MERNLAHEVQKGRSGDRSCLQLGNLEVVEICASFGELAKWPLLDSILARVFINLEHLETLFRVSVAPNIIEQGVDSLGR